MTAEHQRLTVNGTKKIPLEQWGPYLSERQWGTVREDYSNTGDAWNYFPYKHAHCRAVMLYYKACTLFAAINRKNPCWQKMQVFVVCQLRQISLGRQSEK